MKHILLLMTLVSSLILQKDLFSYLKMKNCNPWSSSIDSLSIVPFPPTPNSNFSFSASVLLRRNQTIHPGAIAGTIVSDVDGNTIFSSFSPICSDNVCPESRVEALAQVFLPSGFQKINLSSFIINGPSFNSSESFDALLCVAGTIPI